MKITKEMIMKHMEETGKLQFLTMRTKNFLHRLEKADEEDQKTMKRYAEEIGMKTEEDPEWDAYMQCVTLYERYLGYQHMLSQVGEARDAFSAMENVGADLEAERASIQAKMHEIAEEAKRAYQLGRSYAHFCGNRKIINFCES